MSNLTITLVQTDLHWEDVKANLEMLEKKILDIREKTELVILPEMFSTGFSMNPQGLAETMEGPAVQWMKRIAREKKIILTGSLIIKEMDQAGRPLYYNRLVWMQPDGQYGIYDKRHRFAYAGEDEQYSAGSKRLITSVNGWRINLLICYDLRFPVLARQNPSQPGKDTGFEYDLLVYVANWPEKRIHAWTTLLQARAIENQCYVAGVNRVGEDGNRIHYTGESMVVDPLGEILYRQKDREDLYTLTLDKTRLEEARNRFPFWKDADRFRILNS